MINNSISQEFQTCISVIFMLYCIYNIFDESCSSAVSNPQWTFMSWDDGTLYCSISYGYNLDTVTISYTLELIWNFLTGLGQQLFSFVSSCLHPQAPHKLLMTMFFCISLGCLNAVYSFDVAGGRGWKRCREMRTPCFIELNSIMVCRNIN